METERRKHTRLLSQDNAFAALGSNYSKVGKIKNVSRGGLAFEYIVGEEEEEISCQVDIFLIGQVFHLSGIPCRPVYDEVTQVLNANNHYVKVLTTKCCGIQFGELNEDVKVQLERFIEASKKSVSQKAKP
jgi:hypothetical protein